MVEQKSEEKLFTIYAIRKHETTALIQMGLSWERLMEDIVQPFDSGDMFFIDGAPVKATDLDRLKILVETESFRGAFATLNWHLRTGDTKAKEMYIKQYHGFIEALLREHGQDVTSQVVSAFRIAIKPKIRDYMPNKEALLDAAVKIFSESAKAFFPK